MKPLDLLKVAETLLDSGRGRPSSASCRRAISSIYYALFHCLAQDCADLLIGSAGADRSLDAWRQVYRSLDHGLAKERCRNQRMMGRFPTRIQDFGVRFADLQEERHRADYDPAARFAKSIVASSISSTRQTIADYRSVASKDRRAFCAYVLLKQRPG